MIQHRHISEQFETELHALQHTFATMGGLVEEQVQLALRAFKDVDLSLAQEVQNREERVNQFELEIDKETTTIIARRQPAASDLRLLVGLLKSSTDLERIGDEASRIAKIMIKDGPYTASIEQLLPVIDNVTELHSIVIRNLNESLNHFARQNESGALNTIARDSSVDDLYNEIIDICSEGMTEHPDHVNSYMSVIWVARALERIGDHAKNISENVIYAVKGVDIRHSGS